jgi:hypothetical protein
MAVLLLRVVFAVGAFLCGVRALGYWVVLQVGGVRSAERGGIALVICCSALLFIILSSASAYLQERTNGARAIVVKAVFLNGAYGLPSIALFTVASRGAVLQRPEVLGLLMLFACFVLVFRPSIPKQTTPDGSREIG